MSTHLSTAIALVRSPELRDALRGMTLFDDPAAAAEAQRRAPAWLVVLELSAFADAAQVAHPLSELIVVLAEAADAERAIALGASDVIVSPSAAELGMRVALARARAKRSGQIRDDAAVLHTMTAAPGSDLRFWEFDLRDKRFTRLLPAIGTERHYSEERLARQRWEEMYPAPARARVREAVRELLSVFHASRALEPRALDLEIQNPDGSSGSRRVILFLGLDAQGAPRLLRGVTLDTTDAIEARRQSELVRGERARARDDAIAQAHRLESARRLAGGIAHDFNNLLMVIESCADAITSPVADRDHAQTSEDVTELNDAVSRAKGLVQQLLLFARQAPLRAELVDPVEIVRGMRSTLQRLVGDGVRLDLVLGGGAARFLRIDPSQLEQLALNLVVNARDACEGRGHVVVAVDARPGSIVLAVRDDGCGMDEPTRLRMFEPFFTTKPAGRGMGLGLATVHGIVSAAGGHIEVESAPGEGTEIRLVLPEEAALRSSHTTLRPPRPATGGRAILLVEDDGAVRRLLSRELRRFGYAVTECAGGEEALDAAITRGVAFDLLVADVVMPGLGGADLARRLVSTQPALKVLFISGLLDRRVQDQIRLESLGEILPKPFTARQLGDRVDELLGLARAAS